MEGSSSSRKRPFFEDDDDSNKPKQKRVRFPKGKKVKAVPEPEVFKEEEEQIPQDLSDPRVAAKERAKRRTQTVVADDGDVDLTRISEVEVRYQVNESFVEDGIEMEPFNLEREREEGYFDEAGNFVEFVTDKEEKDAWLDSVQVDTKLAERISSVTKDDHEEQDLSADDIGKIKRRIANALEPGETVLQALKRLKGNSSDKRAKMSAETKREFDQLTEDAMKLMDNGDYDVYHEAQEAFEREAEGYEALARARNNVPADASDTFDMFGDEDEVAGKSEENQTSVPSATHSQTAAIKETVDSGSSWVGQSDYVYDEASGYYYSSSLGYYYDPQTGLFCSAVSGQWYKYNEDSGTYDEVQSCEPQAASNAS